MRVIETYQCGLCNGIYNQPAHAELCERQHIELRDIQVVRAIHSKCAGMLLPPEGAWPSALIVGIDRYGEKLMRYKLDDVELEEFGDHFYQSGAGIKR